MVPDVTSAGAAGPPLPPSWNAHRHALAALGLVLDAIDCYGFGGGLGFLYVRAPAPVLLAFGSLDPMEELAIAAGAWVDRRHSIDRTAAVAEMREHLARERTPVIVPLRLDPGDDREIGAESARPERCTFAGVCEIGRDRVVCLRGPAAERVELSLPIWLDRLSEGGRRWSVILSNGRFTQIGQRLRSSLRHAAHRLAVGWRGRLGGMTALDVFCSDLRLRTPDSASVEETLHASAQLGGGMGRGLFAAFLARHEELLPGRAAPLRRHLADLDAAWRAIETGLCRGNRPSAASLREIRRSEAAGLDLLRQVADAGRACRSGSAAAPC